MEASFYGRIRFILTSEMNEWSSKRRGSAKMYARSLLYPHTRQGNEFKEKGEREKTRTYVRAPKFTGWKDNKCFFSKRELQRIEAFNERKA